MFARCQETFACFIHTPDPRGAFEVSDEEREALLRKALWRARLRHLAGQFPRHPDRPQGQCDDQRFRRAQDPPAGEEPGRRRKADPEEPRLWHPPAAARDLLLRGLQPGQCRAGRHHGDADRADHAKGHQDQREGIRIRHHHLRHRLRRHHRQFRQDRFPRRRRRAAEGQMEERPGDLSRHHGRTASPT